MNNVSEIADFRNKKIDEIIESTFEILLTLGEGEILEIIISEDVDKNDVIDRLGENRNYRIEEVSELRSGIHIFIRVF
jgi:TusA-related sulfurtransferase